MKIYLWLVTILVLIWLGYQATSYVVDKNNNPQDIAFFEDSNKKTKAFKLSYKKNGDLIFSSVILQSSIPSVTHWDYYGSTEVVNYKWINKNTILIETKDSIIKIVVPVFKVDGK